MVYKFLLIGKNPDSLCEFIKCRVEYYINDENNEIVDEECEEDY